MAKGGLILWLMVGLKMLVAGILATVALLIPAAVLGFTVFSMNTVTSGGAGAFATGSALWLGFMVASIIVEGYIANRLWRWT